MSTNSRAHDPNLRDMLLEGHFGKSEDLPPADPLTTTQMVLGIEKIKPYDRNPRREINPKYDAIKASIRAQRGLNNPLTITRRPGDDLYMVESGGNTRLTILKELWQETQDEAFHKLHCLFVPWVSESHVLTAHLVENELRGDMMLIDKAFALISLQEELEEEQGKALSRSEFQRKLLEIGYHVSRRQMIRLEYAAEFLDALLPKALRAGLGPWQIDQIRNAEKAYRAFCNALSEFTTPFEPLFCAVLSQHDHEDWDFKAVRRELNRRIADATSISLNRIRLEIDALLHEKSETDTDVDDHPDSDIGGQLPPSNPTPTNSGVNYPKNSKPIPHESDNGLATCTTPSRESNPPTTDIELSTGEYRRTTDLSESTEFLDPALNKSQDRLPSKTDLKSLRSRCYILALRFAKGFSFQQLIKPAASGHGFFIDIPPQSINKEALWWAWWLLFALSEQAVTEKRLRLAPKGMQLPSMIFADRMNDVFDRAGTPPETSLIGHAFLHSPKVSEHSFRDLLLLIESCRVLRMNFEDSVLWKKQTVTNENPTGNDG